MTENLSDRGPHRSPGPDDNPERQADSTLARKVASTLAQITAADLTLLRDRGFRDADILEVVLATAIASGGATRQRSYRARLAIVAFRVGDGVITAVARASSGR